MCVCVSLSACMRVCASQCQRASERERESVCVCAFVWSVSRRMSVRACARARIHQSPSQNLGPPTDTDSAVDVVLLKTCEGFMIR